MAELHFDREFDPQYGVAVQVSPRVARVVCNNPGAFTFTGTGTYLIGTDTLAVIDPGPDDDKHFSALRAAIGGRPVSHILITHTHMDHSPLAQRLKGATGAKTYGYGPHGSGGASGDLVLDASGDTEFMPDIEVRHGDVFEIPGCTFETVFTPGHTSNHVAFSLREENALFSGDHIMAWSTSVIAPPDGNMADYFSSLDTVLARDEDTYWPTHGPAKKDPKAFVRAFKTHRKMREEAIYNRIRKGDRQVMEIVRAIYADVDPRLHNAAAMSTLAHLHHMIEQDKIRVEGAADLKGTYYAPGSL